MPVHGHSCRGHVRIILRDYRYDNNVRFYFFFLRTSPSYPPRGRNIIFENPFPAIGNRVEYLQPAAPSSQIPRSVDVRLYTPCTRHSINKVRRFSPGSFRPFPALPGSSRLFLSGLNHHIIYSYQYCALCAPRPPTKVFPAVYSGKRPVAGVEKGRTSSRILLRYYYYYNSAP